MYRRIRKNKEKSQQMRKECKKAQKSEKQTKNIIKGENVMINNCLPHFSAG